MESSRNESKRKRPLRGIEARPTFGEEVGLLFCP